jgi:hypothetical protein
LIAAVTCGYRLQVVIAATIDTQLLRIMVAELRAAGASIWQHAQFAGFCVESLIMSANTAFGGAARLPGRRLACPRFCPEGSQRLAGQGSRSDREATRSALEA